MKIVSILVFLVALGVTAALTRPSEASFRTALESRISQRSDGNLQMMFARMRMDDAIKRSKFHRHLFWVDVEKDGKVIYTGALGHWMECNIARRFS